MAYTKELAEILLRGPVADMPSASIGRYWYLATDDDPGTLYKCFFKQLFRYDSAREASKNFVITNVS